MTESAAVEPIADDERAWIMGMIEHGKHPDSPNHSLRAYESRLVQAEDRVREAEDKATVGENLLNAISCCSQHELLKDWRPINCPSEIVCDLLNEFDELRQAIKGDGKS